MKQTMTPTILSDGTPFYDLSKAGIQKEDALKPYWFDITQPIPDPVPVLKKGDISLCTRGNFSCITGAAKARKTYFISSMVGAFLSETEHMDMTGIGGQALYIDTEQDLRDVNRVIKRIYRIAGLPEDVNNPDLKVLLLRETDPLKRRELCEIAINEVKPVLCVIDGVSDLMLDTNSNTEAIEICNMLLRLTSQFDCHIITALHTNPGTDKARGHIGSEIQRKATTVLNVSKDGDTSLVKAAFCRGKDVPDFAFFINSRDIPELTEIETKTSKTMKLKDMFTAIIPLPNTMPYSDLVSKVVEKAGVKERQAKNKIKDAVDQNVLEINSVGYYHLKQSKNDNDEYPF